jgi:hypothetical protein
VLIMMTTDTATRQSAPEQQGWEDELRAGLDRFADELTRVVAHLSSESGPTGPAALRCVLEAVPAGRSPLVVTEDASTVEGSVRGALHQLVRLLTSHDGKLRDDKGGETVRHPRPTTA